MKKASFLAAAILIGAYSFGQTTVSNDVITFPAPHAQGPLIKGNIQNDWQGFIISAGDGSPASGAYMHFFPTDLSNYNSPTGGRIGLVSVGSESGNAGNGIEFSNYDPSLNHWNRMLTLRKDGRCSIGNALEVSQNYPGNYKLYVQDGILTEKLRVAIRTTGNWADYVFAPNYKLMSLQHLKKFIEANQHLPEIPSASQLVKEGIDVTEMQAKQMQKIEELTLYIIQLNEKIQELEKKLENK